MARTIFRISIALLGSLALIIGESYYLYTCGPGFDYERYRVSYVDPDLLSDSLYQSLYGSLLREHQAADNYWDSPHEEFRNEGWQSLRDAEIVRDWRGYFGNQVTDRSIEHLIGMADEDILLDALGTLTTEGSLERSKDIIEVYEPEGEEDEWWAEERQPDTIAVGEAFRFIGRTNDTALLHYLLFARDASDYAFDAPSEWHEERSWSDYEWMGSLITQGRERYLRERSPFLRERYAFQLVRLARYAKWYGEAVDLYDSLIAPSSDRSSLRYRALAHKAGALRKLGDTVGSNVYFAHVFDSSEAERETALRDLCLRTPYDWERLYARATNDHERSVLWMMKGLKEKSLDFDYIERMAELEPGSSFVSLALLRELHRIESYLYDDRETRDLKARQSGLFLYHDMYDPVSETWRMRTTNVQMGWSTTYRRHIAPQPFWDTLHYLAPVIEGDSVLRPPIRIMSARDYVMAFRGFVLEQAKAGNVREPALWYMVAGYIDMMDGDYDLADECLGEARDAVGGNTDLRQQIRLLEYLRTRMKGGSDDATTGEQIVETLRWMEEKQNANRHSKYDKTMAALGRDYLRRDDVPRAILAFNRARDETARNLLLDMYATDDELNKLLIMMRSERSMPLDRMLLDSFVLTDDDLLDLRATRMMRRGEFAKADEIYRTITPAYWSEESPSGQTACFRFTTDRTVVDTNLPRLVRTGTEETALRMTRKEFAAEIVRLQGMEKMKSAAGDSATLAIANLLYNAPYWGYASTVWNGGWLWGMRFSYFGPSAYPFNIPVVAERMERAQEAFLREYGSRAPARTYYRKTMERTKDRELAAFCANMLDLCDKQPQTSFHPRVAIKDQPREGYDLLLTKYRDTRYAKAALSQCSVYRGFAGR